MTTWSSIGSLSRSTWLSVVNKSDVKGEAPSFRKKQTQEPAHFLNELGTRIGWSAGWQSGCRSHSVDESAFNSFVKQFNLRTIGFSPPSHVDGPIIQTTQCSNFVPEPLDGSNWTWDAVQGISMNPLCTPFTPVVSDEDRRRLLDAAAGTAIVRNADGNFAVACAGSKEVMDSKSTSYRKVKVRKCHE